MAIFYLRIILMLINSLVCVRSRIIIQKPVDGFTYMAISRRKDFQDFNTAALVWLIDKNVYV